MCFRCDIGVTPRGRNLVVAKTSSPDSALFFKKTISRACGQRFPEPRAQGVVVRATGRSGACAVAVGHGGERRDRPWVARGVAQEI